MHAGFGYFWWGGLGAIVGGWMSALLSAHSLLAAAGVLDGPTAGSGLAATANHAHRMVLAGLPMGAAAGVCLARYLLPRPVLALKFMRATAMLPLVGVMLGRLPLAVFSGSVAGLHVGRDGVRIIAMRVFPPDHLTSVPVGHASYACGPGISNVYAAYRDRSAVVEVCVLTLFPSRW